MRSRPERSRPALVAALVFAALSSAACHGEKRRPPQADASTRRTTPAGDLVGYRSPYGSDAWAGIPFARPPVAEMRWRAPEPALPWTGLRPAIAAGPQCVQYASPMGGTQDKP